MNNPLPSTHDGLNVEHDEVLRILCAHFGVEGSYLIAQTEAGKPGRLPRLERVVIVIPKAEKTTTGEDEYGDEAWHELKRWKAGDAPVQVDTREALRTTRPSGLYFIPDRTNDDVMDPTVFAPVARDWDGRALPRTAAPSARTTENE